MAASGLIDPRVRLAISRWPDDAPRGAVSTFCAEHGISRKSFYELGKRAKADGPAAVLEPRTRRPRSSRSKLTEEVKEQAIQVRAALEASGLDHGPISVHEKDARDGGATEYVLTGGRKCVILQLIDDHSRYALASHVASSETAKDAIAVFDTVAAHGVPQRLLSDNGLALNPSRRGYVGQLVAHVGDLGVEAITGKPYKPTTQGNNERFHQTLFRYLDKQPLADTLTELQAQVDAFDHLYNTQRPHQGPPGRITPPAAWQVTPQADPPRPRPDRPVYQPPVPVRRPRPRPPADHPADTCIRTVSTAGTIGLDKVSDKVDIDHAFEQVLVIADGDQTGDKITITDLLGENLAEHTRAAPASATSATADHQEPAPRTRQCHRSPDTPTVTDVLIQNCHPCPETSQWGRTGIREKPAAYRDSAG